jgi:hypothetical protein
VPSVAQDLEAQGLVEKLETVEAPSVRVFSQLEDPGGPLGWQEPWPLGNSQMFVGRYLYPDGYPSAVVMPIQ